MFFLQVNIGIFIKFNRYCYIGLVWYGYLSQLFDWPDIKLFIFISILY